MELTIPYNSPESLANAYARKSTKQNYLSNLERKGHNTLLVTIEIGALAHSLTTTHRSLQNLLPTLSRRATRAMFDDAAKIAITAPHTIFLARKSQVWPDYRNLLSWLFLFPVFFWGVLHRYIDFPVLFHIPTALAKPICIFSIRLVPCSPRAFPSSAIVLS